MSSAALTILAPSPPVDPTLSLSRLGKAALEAGCSVDDVHDYEAGRQSYKVKFFDARASRKGKGVKVTFFTDLTEAENFASQNQLYARACKVETIQPLTLEQQKVANAAFFGVSP